MGFAPKPNFRWWKHQMDCLLKRLRTERGKTVAKAIFSMRFGWKYQGPYAEDAKRLLIPVTNLNRK
jgi:hypothetical protein